MGKFNTVIGLLLLLVSCSDGNQTPLVSQLKLNDLYQKGQSCTGLFFRIDNSELILSDGNNKRVIGEQISFLESGQAVTIVDGSRGNFTLNTVFTFNSDGKFVKITDFYPNPEPTDQMWQQYKAKSGKGKEVFEAYRDALRKMPTLEVCPRRSGS